MCSCYLRCCDNGRLTINCFKSQYLKHFKSPTTVLICVNGDFIGKSSHVFGLQRNARLSCEHARVHAHREASVMAVNSMSAPARVFVLHLCLLGGLLQVLVHGEGKKSDIYSPCFFSRVQLTSTFQLIQFVSKQGKYVLYNNCSATVLVFYKGKLHDVRMNILEHEIFHKYKHLFDGWIFSYAARLEQAYSQHSTVFIINVFEK